MLSRNSIWSVSASKGIIISCLVPTVVSKVKIAKRPLLATSHLYLSPRVDHLVRQAQASDPLLAWVAPARIANGGRGAKPRSLISNALRAPARYAPGAIRGRIVARRGERRLTLMLYAVNPLECDLTMLRGPGGYASDPD